MKRQPILPPTILLSALQCHYHCTDLSRKYFLIIPGPCLRIGGRNMPDSRSCLQIGRLYCLLLHSARRHAPHILPHRSAAGPTTAEPGNDRKRRLGQWLAGASANSTYVLIYFVQFITHFTLLPSSPPRLSLFSVCAVFIS